MLLRFCYLLSKTAFRPRAVFAFTPVTGQYSIRSTGISVSARAVPSCTIPHFQQTFRHSIRPLINDRSRSIFNSPPHRWHTRTDPSRYRCVLSFSAIAHFLPAFYLLNPLNLL